MYLYHYPLFLILDGQRTGLSGLALLVVRLAATGAMAVASYHLVELPLRNRRRIALRPLLLSGAACLAALVAGLVVATLPVAAQTVPISAAGKASLHDIPRKVPAALTGGKRVRVVLLGDSLALTLGEGLGKDAGAWGIQFDNQGAIGCDLDPDSTVNIEGSISEAAQGCVDWPTKWTQLVDTRDPDVVAIELGRWEVSDRTVDGKWSAIGEKAWDDLYAAELTRAITILSSKGAHIALFTLPYILQTTDAPDGTPWDINQPVRTNDYNALIRRTWRPGSPRRSR